MPTIDQSKLVVPLLFLISVILFYAMVYRKLGRVSRNRVVLLALVVSIIAGSWYFLFADPIYNHINRGLDLAGGIHVVLEAEDTGENRVNDWNMQKTVDVIRNRVDRLGVAEPVIQREGSRRIIVELPGIKDMDEALEVLGKPAYLEFVDSEGTVWVTGADLKNADIGKIGDSPVVTLSFNAEGTKKFAEATEKNLHKTLAIVLDGEVISAPVVENVITGGEAYIKGYYTVEEAYRLAIMLNSGALPLKLNIVENRSVSATLGEDSIQRSLRAGIIGVSAVVLFMVAFYRLPGALADLALSVYVILLLAVLAGINASLTLPGIAGLILSVGMAVDANVIIFERIREETKTGKTVLSAIDSGFKQAFRTILDANITTLIGAGVLFYFGAGPIRGFAVTLSLGILISMFTAIVVTRLLIRTVVNSKLFKNAKMLWGV
ncbi:MAG: protein translocase subunit SecD [Bacillota bacterium]